MSLPSGIITFLFTDIEGSTELWEQFRDAMGKALARHDAILRKAIQANQGYIFNKGGDGFYAAFHTPLQAFAAALSAQRALQVKLHPKIGRLRVRMAIHTGTAEERDGDYFGPAVNRVARLMAIGHGGQVLLSEVTHGMVKENLPAGTSLKDLGSHRLKDLMAPEQVFQLLHPSLPADFPPLKSLDTYPTNLPVQLTSFIGREKEIEELKHLLAQARLVTVAGSGGCGKTRLALQVAADLVEEYTDGVWQVELAVVSDPSLVAQEVASALGLREEPARPLLQTLREYLEQKQLLLLLDNCEHLLPACAELAQDLLKSCQQLRLLVTSREVFKVAGEQVYRVPSLLSPDPAHLPTEEKDLAAFVLGHEAPRLLLERARLQRPKFTLTTQNASAVASVCHRLDGIPLAIELAASRVNTLSVEEINTRLEHRFRLLTGGSITPPPRQKTLQATLDWSYELLSEKERQMHARLCVFAGGWTLEAAEGVCTEDRDATLSVLRAETKIDVEEVLDLLASLVDKSLVIAEEREGKSRYRMLETLREYGRQKLKESGQEKRWRARHLEFFLTLAEEAEPELTGGKQAEWLEKLQEEHDNMRAALKWCQQDKDSQKAGLRLAGALSRFWYVRGNLREGREHLQAALAEESTRPSTPAQAKALNGAGNLARMQGDYPAAHTLHEESLAIRRELGDQAGIADSLNNLGVVAWYQGDYAAACALHKESLAIERELGDKRGIAISLNNLGLVARDQGDDTTARALYEESLAIRKELGDQAGIASSLLNLGFVAKDQGDYATARALFEQSLAIDRELGNRWGIATSLGSLGNVTEYQGDYLAARVLYEESLAIGRELGDRWGIANSLMNLGNVAYRQGDYAAARTFHEQSLAIKRETGDKRGIAYSLEAMAGLVAGQGQTERAVRIWAAAEALRKDIGAPLPPNEKGEYDRLIASARAVLGEEAFDAAWVAGCAMTLEQAIEYALLEEEGYA